jgi:hypothetical protein
MELSMDDILKMTVADRKTYISVHNKEVEKEREALKVRHR